ncbi:triacylglycerol lipase [Maridesulfovibrio ferrireducens]|uniref:esterase/lipase family protein n=1 Tax=Maridesulfovibrio ferrireducens TaxID=246191 RepID=UPI001A1F857F|nr:alpha/beta fold hydrolase [Maridesulfovibrio ferrireducens]MBI9113019.1 hypothetical protein [Maridesulfovibrio ferrireducens]
MTKIFLTILLIILMIPLPLIIVMTIANRKELMLRGTRQAVYDLLISVATTVISMLTATLTRPFDFLCRDIHPEKEGNPLPVLMTHGLYHNKTAWFLMKPRLRKAGYSNLNTWSYNSFTTSYPELVLKLRRRILKLYAENNNQKIVLIGHSLGGLIIKGAVSDPAVAESVAKVITLGTPFRGSLLAKIAPGRLGRSLHPENSLFQTIHTTPPLNFIQKTAIFSPVDEMVLPWKNLLPRETDWKTLPCPAMGHVAMLYSPKITNMIIRIMQQ